MKRSYLLIVILSMLLTPALTPAKEATADTDGDWNSPPIKDADKDRGEGNAQRRACKSHKFGDWSKPYTDYSGCTLKDRDGHVTAAGQQSRSCVVRYCDKCGESDVACGRWGACIPISYSR